jgi:serine/threonine protein kinase
MYYMSEEEISLLKKMIEKDPTKRISVEEALAHTYFHDEPDQEDIIWDENCDLSSKVSDLQIMNCSSKAEGVIFLYSLLRSSKKQSSMND